jgi:hypothetical protein
MNRINIVALMLLALACNPEGQHEEPWKENTVSYLKNPENLNDIAMYEPMEFSLPDTLAGDTAYSVEHLYKGLNVASREVRRKALIYFDPDWQVLGYENIDYLDPMTKAQRKGRPEDKE